VVGQGGGLSKPAAGREQKQKTDGQRGVRRGQHHRQAAQQAREALAHEAACEQRGCAPPGQQRGGQAGPQGQQRGVGERGVLRECTPGRRVAAGLERFERGPQHRHGRQRQQGACTQVPT